MKRRIAALLLILALVLSSCRMIGDDILDRSFDTVSETAESSESSETSEDDEPHELLFDDIKYARPDFEALGTYYNEIIALIDAGASSDEVKAKLDGYEDAMLYAYTMLSLVSLYNALDTSDAELNEEYGVIAELYNAKLQQYISAIARIADSDYKDAVLSDWSEDEIADVLTRASYYDGEFAAMQAEFDSLTQSAASLEYTLELDFRGGKATLAEIYGISGVTNAELDAAEAEYADKITQLYLDIITLGNSMAKLAGYDDYADYAYSKVYGRDYTAEQALQLCDGIASSASAIASKAAGGVLSTDEYRAYSKLAGSDVLKQYGSVLTEYLSDIDDMTAVWEDMTRRGFCLIESKDNQMSSSFTAFLDYYGESFMFINKKSSIADLFSVAHEFGHYYASRQFSGSDTPLEIAEIQSQTGEYLIVGYTGGCGVNAKSALTKYVMLRSLSSLQVSGAISEFEIYAFTAKDVDGAKLDSKWQELSSKYGVSGYGYDWRDVLHICYSPLYYISYAVSLIPALEIYDISTADKDAALQIYSEILHYDGRMSLDELLGVCGLASPFEVGTVTGILQIIDKALF